MARDDGTSGGPRRWQLRRRHTPILASPPALEGNLRLHPYATPALRAFAFAIVVSLTGIAAPSRAATFQQDFGPGCATMSVAGRTITCNDGTTIALHSSVTPGCVNFVLVPQGADFTLTCVSPNLTGLWWNAAENGRGTWISHQGNTVFAVDYAYDAANVPRWRTVIAFQKGAGTYVGDVYATSGPPLQSTTFDPHGVAPSWLGVGSIVQDDVTHVRLNLDDGSSRVLAKQQFGPLPTCTFGTVTDLSTLTNYTDLWWNPNEAGWGINLAHQGDTIFAAWYTYGTDGTPLFLVVAANKTVPGTYSGDLYQALGPAGPALQSTKVGTATFTFANGNGATFAYTAQLAGMTTAATQTKAITREIFTAPGTTCQ